MARRKKTTEEKPTEVTGSSDDNFGLPDIDYTPIDRTEETPVNQEASSPEAEPVRTQTEHYSASSESTDSGTTSHSSYESTYTYTPPKDEGSMVPKIVGIIVVVLLALAATYYFAVYKPQKEVEEKALLEKKRKDAEAKEQQERQAEQQRLEEERRRAQAEAEANAKPKEGSIETLSERTKRYYVVVSSSIDGDLVMDYAKKLSANGVNCKIIPPYGKVKFSRLTIAEGDTYANAQSIADGLKGQYGDGLWVIKY